MVLKSGDIILTSKDSWIVGFMQFFQPDPVKYGHAMVVDMEHNCALEAGVTIRCTPLAKAFTGRHKHYKVLRYKKLTAKQVRVMLKAMRSLIGKIYSVKRMFLQFLDHVCYTNWFTKLDKSRGSQICSSYVAWGYYASCKIKFNGVHWPSADPDDFSDEREKNPDDWEVIYEA